MTTHPRARAFQAGAFLALIGGSLVVAPTPALAKAPSVVITSLPSSNLKAGERVTLTYRVTNTNLPVLGGDKVVNVSVNVTPGEVRCEGDCSASGPIEPNESENFTITLVAGAMPSGASKNGIVSIKATLGDESASAQRSITVRGDEKPPTAKQISGKLRDQDGKAVSGADVYMVDAQNHNYETTSNASGSFRFFSSDQQPISPGGFTVGARKDGFEVKTATGSVGANATAKIDLVMTSTATPSASASPSPSASASPTPSKQAASTAATEEEPTPEAPTVAPTPAAQSTDEGSGTTLFLVLGGLLVAAGIGAIILVMMRRKDADAAETGAPGDKPAPGGAAMPAPVRPAADATRVAGAGATRIGATRIGAAEPNPAEATMVTTAPLPPSLSEAPTMLQQAVPVEDEFPDPYGAPAVVPHAGYPAAAPFAAPAPRPAPYGGHPYAAVTPPAPQQRYDEPTGMYDPQSDAFHEPYEQQQPAGYADDDAGYQHYDGGYDDAEPQPAEYPPAAGYAQAGYAAGADHAQEPGYGQGGHAGYQPAGYRAAAPAAYPQQAPVAVPYQPGDQPQQYGWAPEADGVAPAAGYAPEVYDDQPAGYDPAYGQPEVYGQPAYGPPGHDEPGHDQLGYGEPGYGQPGYGQPGYGPAPDQTDPHHGGYDEATGYYDAEQPQAGRHGAPPVPPQQAGAVHQGQRRKLDWLDD